MLFILFILQINETFALLIVLSDDADESAGGTTSSSTEWAFETVRGAKGGGAGGVAGVGGASSRQSTAGAARGGHEGADLNGAELQSRARRKVHVIYVATFVQFDYKIAIVAVRH